MNGLTVRLAHYDRTTEAFEFTCPHGRTVAASTTDTASELEAVHAGVLERHRHDTGCDCETVRFENFWERWSDALALWEEDSTNGTRDRMTEYERDLHDLTLKVLREEGCVACDASMLMVFGKGLPNQVRLVHRDGCPREKRGPRVVM